MTPARWQQVKRTLAGALERDDTRERLSFLEASCAGDLELQREVESLLDQPTDQFDVCSENIGLAHDVPLASRNVGRRIGAYQLVRELGRGGMGTVWLAQRADRQFEKFVAIKLLKRGTDTDEVLRRFRAEREILARLEHPNIARLIDAGTTDDDLPYFVMEYVVGERVTDYCASRGLPIEERLQLFLKICGAVQFAHQNLVVHRDLKPANILITAEGEPKLLDFGIAKLLATDDVAAVTLTMVDQQRLTPAYASPEQVRGEAVTTISDVYALGALLYEVLTGTAAHQFSSARPSPAELLRIVGEETPPRPSTAAIEPQAARRLRGDLDTILLQALRKEPARRYPGVNSFAEDVRRYLGNFPVRARKDTFGYRASKFIRRNRVAASAGALAVVALLAGLTATAWQGHVARIERANAVRNFSKVRQLARSVLFDYHDAIAKLPGSTPIREKLVKDSLEYLDGLAKENASDPSLEQEIAAAYLKIGDVQGEPYTANLGDTEGALASYRRAQSTLERLAPADPTNPDLQHDLSQAYRKISQIHIRRGAWEESLSIQRKGTDIAEKLVANYPDRPRYRELLAESYLNIGKAVYQAGSTESVEAQRAALEKFRQALAVRAPLLAAEPENAAIRGRVASNLCYVGYALSGIARLTGDTAPWREATGNYQRAAELWSSSVATDPMNTQAKRGLVTTLVDLAHNHLFLGDAGSAVTTFQRALAMGEQIAAADPTNTEAQRDVADLHGGISKAYAQAGDIPAAERHSREEIGTYEALLKFDPESAETRAYLVNAYELMAELSLRTNAFTNALTSYEKALALVEQRSVTGPPDTEVKRLVAVEHANIARVYVLRSRDVDRPAVDQREDRRRAAEAFRNSLAVYEALATAGELAAVHAGKPAEIRQALAEAEAALQADVTTP